MKDENIMKLDFSIAAPTLILPFSKTNIQKEECIVLNCGKLEIKTNEYMLRKDVKSEDKIYDMFEIILSSTKLQLYKSIENYNSEIINEHNYFNLIDNFFLTIGLRILRGPAVQLYKKKPKILIEGCLHVLDLRINDKIYRKLVKIPEFLQIPKDSEDILKNKIEVEVKKKEILKNAEKMGKIWKRGFTIHKWKEMNGVLSNNYIYFYEHPKDQNYESFIYVRGANVKNANDGFGMNNSFIVIPIFYLILIF